MGYSLEDAEREAGEDRFIAQILEENRDAIIGEFTEERLRSYYIDHPELGNAAMAALEEARKLHSTSANAALVFAYAAFEIGLRDLLLKPVVAGLVHNEDMSEVLAAVIDVRNGKTEDLLFAILDMTRAPNLREMRMSDGSRSVWAEKSAVQKRRNLILHKGESALPEEADRALALATFLLFDLYPKVRNHFVIGRYW